MGKVVFWLAVIFGVLFVLRLINVTKAKRNAAKRGDGARPPAGAMVRCVRCGVFLPAAEAVEGDAGPTCGEPGCVDRR